MQESSSTREGWRGPLHPGEIIRVRFFDKLNITQAEFCRRFPIGQSQLSRILAGQSSITKDSAKVFSEAFGMTPMFFMNLQNAYDLQLSSDEGGEERPAEEWGNS